MTIRAAIDTNILVYAALEPVSVKGIRAAETITRASDGGIIAAQALLEFVAVIRRREPSLTEKAIGQVKAWGELFEIAPTITATTSRALFLVQRHHFQVWDAVIWSASLEAGADVFLSEDLQDGVVIDGLRARNPFAMTDDAFDDLFNLRGPLMGDIFISYKREDEAKAARLAKALVAAGFSVWWDRSLLPAESWRSQIQAALDAARAVVVIWTPQSTGPDGDFVRDEAMQAKARGALVPVLMEKTPLPLGFAELQAIDLIGWRGGPQNLFFQDLVAALRAKLDGVAVPRPKGPLARTLRRAGIGLTSGAACAGIFAFSANFMSMQSAICALPPRPILSDSCGALGLGGRPTRAERIAWGQLTPTSCEALRAHIEAFPAGAYRSAAADRLAARRSSQFESWLPVERALPLTVTLVEAGNQDAAREAALARGAVEAEQLCRGFAAGSLFRVAKTAANPQFWDCAGPACGFRGDALCTLEQRVLTETESCG